jgi:hypothetical protein
MPVEHPSDLGKTSSMDPQEDDRRSRTYRTSKLKTMMGLMNLTRIEFCSTNDDGLKRSFRSPRSSTALESDDSEDDIMEIQT